MGFGYDFEGDFVHTHHTNNTGKQEQKQIFPLLQ